MTKDRNFKNFDPLTLGNGSLFGMKCIKGALTHPKIRVSDKEDTVEYGFEFSSTAIGQPGIFRYLGNNIFEEITTRTKFVSQSGILHGNSELDTSKRLEVDLETFQKTCDILSFNPVVINISDALELTNEFKKYYAEEMFHQDNDSLKKSSQIPMFVKKASDIFNSELNEEIEKSIEEIYDVALVDNLIYTYNNSDKSNE